MWLTIRGQGQTFGEDERERVERRLGFAPGRFGDHVGRVAVHLANVNGPRGGADERCKVVAEALGHGLVVVEDTDASLDARIW